MRVIDEEKVINEIERFKGYLDDDMILRIKIAINRLPTTEAELVKHGEWIGKPMIGGYSRMRCSVCDNVFLENKEKWNYCPCCGARMEIEDENAD